VVLIPLSSCAFNVSCLFNGLVYYNQWNRLFWWQLLLVMVGVTITISGVLLLSWRADGWHGTQVQEETVVQQEIVAPYYAAIPNSDDEEQSTSQASPPKPTEKSRLLPDKKHSSGHH
jgi:hypothetical protein